MDKIRLGKTNMMVTRVGFGGIPIQRLTENEAIAVVKSCLELGINFLDTANGYTTSEERIGKAIKGYREKIILATKSRSCDPEELSQHLTLSLKRLGVDYIDLYQFHGINDFASLDKNLEPGGAEAVVMKAQERGIVRHGTYPADRSMSLKKSYVPAFSRLSPPEASDELIPLCRKLDVGFICIKPLESGKCSKSK